MSSSVSQRTLKARREHYCGICAGPIKPGERYLRIVTMVRRGSKRNKTHFHVWTEHEHAPLCDEMFEEFVREQAQESASAQVVAFKIEGRVVQKIALNGSTITETEYACVPVIMARQKPDPTPDDEDDMPF